MFQTQKKLLYFLPVTTLSVQFAMEGLNAISYRHRMCLVNPAWVHLNTWTLHTRVFVSILIFIDLTFL